METKVNAKAQHRKSDSEDAWWHGGLRGGLGLIFTDPFCCYSWRGTRHPNVKQVTGSIKVGTEFGFHGLSHKPMTTG